MKNKFLLSVSCFVFILPFSVLSLNSQASFDLETDAVVTGYNNVRSPGCTAQACSFPYQIEVFTKADAVIMGISGQSVEGHKEFAEKHRLSFMPLSMLMRH